MAKSIFSNDFFNNQVLDIIMEHLLVIGAST